MGEPEEGGGVFDAEVGIEVLKRIGAVMGAHRVSDDVPLIADGIFDAALALAVIHRFGRIEGVCAGVDGGIVGGIDLGDVVV